MLVLNDIHVTFNCGEDVVAVPVAVYYRVTRFPCFSEGFGSTVWQYFRGQDQMTCMLQFLLLS